MGGFLFILHWWAKKAWQDGRERSDTPRMTAACVQNIEFFIIGVCYVDAFNSFHDAYVAEPVCVLC